MTSFFWDLFAFIIALGILITVHEFGHFWVARRCGVWVERFSIGFGPALWKRKDRQGTEYVVALIPLGGYVKMLDSRVMPVEKSREKQAFNHKTLGQRSLIIAAGPVANFLLAIIAYWIVFQCGIPGIKPVTSQIIAGSIADQAKIVPGMELKAIDGIETDDWDEVRMALISKIGDKSITITVAPFGLDKTQQKVLSISQWQFDPEKQDPVRSLGIVAKLPKIATVLQKVQQNSPASKVGLMADDQISMVNGQPLTDWQTFADLVKHNPGKKISLQIHRAGKSMDITLIPATAGNSKQGFVGVVPRVEQLGSEYLTVRHYGPLKAFSEATIKTWQLIKLTTKMFVKLITGNIKLNNLSGPVSIAQGAGASAQYGLIYYLMFIALISVNLGIVNLLPLPVLDGGHLLFLLIEKIKGRPVSERAQDLGYRIGAVVLMLLMVLALFNDFSRLWLGNS